MLNVGFIGAGGIARHHATRMAQLRNVRILAVSDMVPATAAQFAADFGVSRHFSDFRQMLKIDALDAVWICTPTFRHTTPATAAARAGKHIFCEKPIALNMHDANRIVEVCSAASVHLAIGFVRRFDKEWGQLLKIVKSGAIGRPLLWRFVADGKPENLWFRHQTKGGGPLMDGAIHNYDFALQMFGPVESVQASSMQLDNTSVGADTASVILNFESGDQHSLMWTWGLPMGTRTGSLNDVVGPSGCLQFGMTAPSAPKSFDAKRMGVFTLQRGNGKSRVYPYTKTDMFMIQLKHVVGCFEQDKSPMVTGEDGIAALRVALAVLKSGANRRTVKL